MRSWFLSVAFVFAVLVANLAHAADMTSVCPDCRLHFGVGGTYHYWGTTGGVVVPITVTWDRDRYEVGAFRMASSQGFYNTRFQSSMRLAEPYWGFSASRRWELIRAPHWRLMFGLGAAYRSAEDSLTASHWNFAEQLGLRIVPTPQTAIELTMRHWSNAGLKLPNRGQDFATMTVVFSLQPPG